MNRSDFDICTKVLKLLLLSKKSKKRYNVKWVYTGNLTSSIFHQENGYGYNLIADFIEFHFPWGNESITWFRSILHQSRVESKKGLSAYLLTYTVEPLQTATPENQKPLETERFCQSQISVFLFKLPKSPSKPSFHLFGGCSV